MTLIAIVLSLVASAFNATASVLQRRVDRSEPDERRPIPSPNPGGPAHAPDLERIDARALLA